ncbi:amidase signature enzyme [Polychaeton citri CBS 116435]|uniref:Amidase signature enzyme n=1 Tax=Polychaeton citri CBS 116435 TaxID=1314669 RepID=A0A9P4QDN7_9PEZI|nr:amidase signature enzyme [Polychaeton citri CBS 116435]
MKLSNARPYAFRFRPQSTALIIIDMQRDFLDPNGFGAIQCNNDAVFQEVRKIVPRTQTVLSACRSAGMHIMHTREGHKPDLSDLPAAKKLRQLCSPSGNHKLGIGDQGPMGRLLTQGEYGHDIIDELKPFPGEVIIDKPGKGSFWNTTLHRALLARGITHLLVAGVTTECCVNGTAREAADRGFESCILTDCTSGFDETFVSTTFNMFCSYDGLFGYQLAQTPQTKEAGENWNGDLSLPALQKAYANGKLTPTEVVRKVSDKVSAYLSKDPAVWTHVQDADALSKAAHDLEARFKDQPKPPLYGIPFGVKDSIDLAGIKTTVACDTYAYTPDKNARVVDALLNAGALFVGKTNLDQLATGLSGCRSPYGIPRSVFSHDHISGGSSSGSAVAVGAGLVSFALGTDTAGSGRVPAAFNGIVGHKTTKGTYSARGLAPACYTLDTITVLAPNVQDTRSVWLVLDQGPDPKDHYAKTQQSLPLWHVDFRGVQAGGFSFGVPPPHALEVCTMQFRELFDAAIRRLERAGGTAKAIDWKCFEGGSDLLYNQSLVQERIACLGPDFIQNNLAFFTPATKAVFEGALERQIKPWEVYADQHKQQAFTRQAAHIFEEIDVLLVPTVPCHPTVTEMQQEPVKLNSKIGEFTHFANVLDLCGLAVNASFYELEGQRSVKMPFGVTLLGAGGTDGKVFDIAQQFEQAS